MNIEKKRQVKKRKFIENFSFFGAPHVAFLFLPSCFTENGRQAVREAADLGIYFRLLCYQWQLMVFTHVHKPR